MRRLLLAALAAAAAVPFAPGAAVAAPGPGFVCGFTTYLDPLSDRDVLHAEVDAGPLVVDGADAAAAGSITCTFQVNAPLHSGADAAVARSLTTPGVAVLPPTTVSFVAVPWDHVYLCTQVDVVGGGTYYYDPYAEVWTTDPETRCQPTVAPPGPDPFPDWGPVDALVCPLFAVVFPPEGDIEGVWDCPPYGN